MVIPGAVGGSGSDPDTHLNRVHMLEFGEPPSSNVMNTVSPGATSRGTTWDSHASPIEMAFDPDTGPKYAGHAPVLAKVCMSSHMFGVMNVNDGNEASCESEVSGTSLVAQAWLERYTYAGS